MSNTSRSVRKARFGPYEVDFRAGELLKNGRKIRLQDQPFQILVMLLEQPGDVVTREELRQRLWPTDTFVDFDHGLNNAINKLRDALNDSADAPRFIQTLPRRGYRFIAEVNGHMSTESRATGLADSIKAGEAASVVGVEATAKPSPAPSLYRMGKFWLASASMGVAAAAILGLYVGRARLFGANAAVRIQSVAVLPLDNLSGDPSQEYFADGITDALTTELAQIRGVRVISRTSAMHYKGTKKALPEIARELGVDAVVEGSASRTRGVIHVNAQLIYVPGDSHIWAHSYEGAASGLAAMENEIASDVARKIGVETLSGSSNHLSKAAAVNPEAYDFYLRAEPYYGLQTREANDEAIRLLEKSVGIDPQFAVAYAALATAYRTRAFSIEINEPKWIEDANAAVGKALALDPNIAEDYVTRGYLLWSPANGWSVERAVSDYRHALELNPNLAEAHHQLANVYNHVGLLDKADEEIKRAIALDPLNTGIRFRVGINLLYRGKYDESLIELRDSDKFLPPFWAFQTSFALQHLGRRREAQQTVETFLKANPLDPGGSLTVIQALLAAEAGDATLAERKIQDAVTRGRGYQHFHHVAYAAASAYALLNRHELALQYLRLAADDGFPCYPLFEHDPNLDHLRTDPGFLSFLAEQRMQWEYFRGHL
ncbi:MAG TPA: winged helix-turn-helix domain-containing protein [Candidatus Acidoferrum sp.]|nr:winged helix-turn-helix domain-containing protein [Candidatus Acidoferrum sp.]